MSVKNKVCKACGAMADLPIIGAILKPKPKVAVIRLAGVIADSTVKRGGISFVRYEKALEEAFDVYDLKAVALIINSPGGSPAQSELIGNHIRRLSEEKNIPVFAFVEDVAASGGYWLACAADEIFAVSSSIVGSIGVISSSFGVKDLIEKHGIERRVHTSGKDKNFLDPFLEEKPSDVKRLKALQNDLHDIFIDWVKERRGNKLTGSDKELFEGAFWPANQAQDLGLIDGLGSMKAVCREKFGEDIKFTELTPEKGFVSSMIGGEAKMNIPRDITGIIEDKTIWGRYGL